MTLPRRPAPCGDYCNNSASASAFPHAITLSSAAAVLVAVDLSSNLFRCAFGLLSVPKTSRAGRRSGTVDVIRHCAAAARCGSAADCGLRRRPQAEFINGAVISKREPEDASELRETQIEHDEIDPF
jgi:hypothetical protein